MPVNARALTRKPSPTRGNIADLGVGTSRRLLHRVVVGGHELTTWTGWQVTEMSYSAGSAASVATTIDAAFDLMSLSVDKSPISLSIYTTMWLGTNPNPVYKDEEEFAGVISDIEDDYLSDSRQINAISYAQVLLNEKVNEVIASPAQAKRTTSQVVRELTQRFGKGLKAEADDFTTPVGKIFKDQLVKATLNISVWDLFESFAAQDGAELYVKGTTLYYKRKVVNDTKDLTTLKGVTPNLTYTWKKNILALNVRHSPLLSRDITVTVKSVTPHNGQVNTATATLATKKLTRKSNQSQRVISSGAISETRIKNQGNYVFVVPNASQEDCDRIAMQIMEDIARKEFIVTMSVLAQPGLDVRKFIQLEGTKSKVVNQVYAIKSLTKGVGMPGAGGEAQGYVAEVTMVNHAIQTQGTNLGV